jgi:amino acid adenylation domain-containing protein
MKTQVIQAPPLPFRGEQERAVVDATEAGGHSTGTDAGPAAPLPSLARTVRTGFLRSAERFGDRPALQVEGEMLTYRELRDRAASLAATLDKYAPPAAGPAGALTAVFAYRTVTAYAGILSALLRGHGYVPLHRQFPEERTRVMLQRSGCRAMIVDAESAKKLEGVLGGGGPRALAPMVIIAPEQEDVSELAAKFPAHRFIGAGELEPAAQWRPEAVSPDQTAYLLFTSGSTGVPKGVMVTHRNVLAFVDAMASRYGINEHDRFSQMADLTFDLSVLDMFVSWEKGACLVSAPEREILNAGRYIAQNQLTVWFAAPSMTVFIKRLGGLKPGEFPSLRWVLFCGEALAMENVEVWRQAAPNAVIENLYGPTELTVACALYRYDAEKTPEEAENGIVPIGEPYPGMKPLVVDEQLREVPPGETGELLMTGPQLSLGYLNDAEKTAAAFIKPPGKDEVYYRTGDRVRRSKAGRPMTFLGRVDHQIKMRGYRIEPGEIEAVLREEAQVQQAVAVGWPLVSGSAAGIVAFLGVDRADVDAIRDRVERRLPKYMAPREYRLMSDLPLNSNGKVDRKALIKILEGGA